MPASHLFNVPGNELQLLPIGLHQRERVLAPAVLPLLVGLLSILRICLPARKKYDSFHLPVTLAAPAYLHLLSFHFLLPPPHSEALSSCMQTYDGVHSLCPHCQMNCGPATWLEPGNKAKLEFFRWVLCSLQPEKMRCHRLTASKRKLRLLTLCRCGRGCLRAPAMCSSSSRPLH